jgi:predicted AlkP superfamily pyrophosphatase or phosphodiesterase
VLNRSMMSRCLVAVAVSVAVGFGPAPGASAQVSTARVAADRDDSNDPRIRFPEGSGGINQPEHLDAPYVVMISLDGFRYDYMDLFETPNLHRIAAKGVRSRGLKPVYPVKTFPNHYSIATGMYADTHGLVGNRFYEPEFDAYYAIRDRAEVENGRWYGGEPIWVTAETQGMVAASYFWVGSEAPIMGVRPSEWSRFDSTIPYEDRVDKVIEWLERPAAARPHMITLYFEETDNIGHSFPTDSPELAGAVARVDGLIGRLLAGIEKLPHGNQVNVVVVSDHGMGHYTADQSYFLGDLLDLGDDVDVVGSGPQMIMYVDGDDERKNQLRDELSAVLPHVAVYRVGEDMPERLHYATAGARLGDLALVPDFGWTVLPWKESDRPAVDGWTHGWDRTTPQMQALFVAEGPDIAQRGMVPAMENVLVYPLLTEILGLDPNPRADGRAEAIRGLVRVRAGHSP